MLIDDDATVDDPPGIAAGDSAYDGLLDHDSHGRWAFGTGFDEPLSGVDTSVPPGIDAGALASYCLMLADDALVSAQRLAEWSTRAPELEEEVALANIGLDLLGQARLLLSRAAAADPSLVPLVSLTSPIPPDDALAFFRDEFGYRNVRLVELDNGDFARTMVRMLVFTTWRLAVFQPLRWSRDPVLAAVAGRGVSELAYHRDHGARWVVILGRGTAESRRRLIDAVGAVWPYVDELFASQPEERTLVAQGVAIDPASVRDEFDAVVAEVFAAAELDVPAGGASVSMVGCRSGRNGLHTELMGPLLADLQSVARAHPEGRW